ncbi:activated RNA polymerase ii transcriptional coactivator p15 [Anaeramoeba flamelloides]|uniref:Activated RNA polymerase ii transcriptional coactivator p15 n=1 Tax=Anaeramoeba flamelloides TaxID=1746091 RepID=A0ABQ8YFR9_9EUKA|nr:activated RNA polymerase ii transcriptional coactivator p15 [Anaeramoeba flamelloides]
MDQSLKSEAKKSLLQLLPIINLKSTSLDQLIGILEGQLRVEKNSFLKHKAELQQLFIECISLIQSKQLNEQPKQQQPQPQPQQKQQPEQKINQNNNKITKEQTQEKEQKKETKAKENKINKNKKNKKASLNSIEFKENDLFENSDHSTKLSKPNPIIKKQFQNKKPEQEKEKEKEKEKQQEKEKEKEKIKKYQQPNEDIATQKMRQAIPGFIACLGNSCMVTENVFRNVKYVHIRKYFLKNGEWRPTKKGISFTKQQWNEFNSVIPQVQNTIKTKFK